MPDLSVEQVTALIEELKNKSKKVFLGGTCNDSTWRDELIPQLKISYFNPVVPDWTQEAYARELEERKTSDFCLYVLTPKMKGVYSIAEVIDDVNKFPTKTLFCVLPEDGDSKFDASQLKSLEAVKKMVVNNGGIVLSSLQEIADYVNNKALMEHEDTVVLQYILNDLQRVKGEIISHFEKPKLKLPFYPTDKNDPRVVRTMNLVCHTCGAPLGDLRGHIQEKFTTVEAQIYGYCLACQVSQYNQIRWHKDGHWSTRINGEWFDVDFGPESFWQRIKERVKSFFS